MYETFELKRLHKGGHITGYVWEAARAKAVVLLIHGAGEYCGRYERVASLFNKNKIAVLGMDLRGHGRSSGVPGDCAPREQVFTDIDELYEYATIRWPGLPVFIYGHSMGGNLVLDYRLRGKYNDCFGGYILSAPWLILRKEYAVPVVELMKTMGKVAPKTEFKGTIDESLLGNPLNMRSYRYDPLVHQVLTARCIADMYTAGVQMDSDIRPDNGRAKKIPMLLMHGTADALISIEGSRALAKREAEVTDYAEWEGYLHEIHNGGPLETGDKVIYRMIFFILANLTLP